MSASRKLLWFVVLIILSLPVAQCQTGNTTPPPNVKKATDKTAPEQKPVIKKPAVKSEGGASQGNAPSAETPKADAAKPNLARPLGNARIDAVPSDYSSVSLRGCGSYQSELRKVTCDSKGFQARVNEGLRAHLKQFHVGDVVRVEINDKGELEDLRGAVSIPEEGISPYYRFLVLAACALLILGLAAAATLGSPFKFIVGLDHRYSNSKTQVALWFWVVMSTYLATVAFRVWYAGWDFFGAVSIPQNLLVLSGLSAITFGGAKAITTAKADAAAHPVDPPGTTVPRIAIADPKGVNARADGDERFFKDLLQNDLGNVDFGDFQMLVVTLVAVVMYMTLIFHSLGTVEFLKTATLPDVDTTILAGFGLGHGAYLAKKAGGDVGTS